MRAEFPNVDVAADPLWACDRNGVLLLSDTGFENLSGPAICSTWEAEGVLAEQARLMTTLFAQGRRLTDSRFAI